MITSNLYNQILIEPVQQNCSEIFIVSGYSSATFLRHHFEEIKKINPEIKINLLIGMKRQKVDHKSFVDLITGNPGLINGYYHHGTGEVHSKVYSWTKNNLPKIGFSGSANYSREAFLGSQGNQMMGDDPFQIKDYFFECCEKSTKIEEYTLTEKDKIDLTDIETDDKNVKGSLKAGTVQWIKQDRTVRISHLTKKGIVAEGSGLNWGHRKDGTKRNKNQAELRIRSDANRKGFLPEMKLKFTLRTDDGHEMDCKVSQTGRKAITTTNSNAELGLYIRKRLGLNSGAFIEKKHLLDYGRTDFILKKLDPETFYFDFSKPD